MASAEGRRFVCLNLLIVCLLLAELSAVTRVTAASVKRPGFKNGSSDRFSHGFGKRDSSRDRTSEYRPTLAELLLNEQAYSDFSPSGYNGPTIQDLIEAMQRQRNAERDYNPDLPTYTS